MNYPVPNYGVAVPAAKTSTVKIVVIVIVVVVVVLIVAAVAIGLGVGLGVGLSKKNDHSSSSGGSSSSSSSGSVLSPPTVTCTYGGSSTCGCAATKPSFLTSRIIQGYTAVANSWPWIVFILINNNNNDKRSCGGFLVTYQHVVTAAHCVEGVTGTITVYAGIQRISSLSSGQSRIVSTFKIYDGYSSSTQLNDIAVLTLVSAFDQTTTVGKCCLTSDASLPSVGEHGVIAGWGKTSSSSSSLSDNLLQGVIQVQSSSLCSSTSTSNIRFCAGYDGTHICNGDSGSPFMTSVNNAWTCTGIASSTTEDCSANGIYTRVSYYRSFIDGIVNGK